MFGTFELVAMDLKQQVEVQILQSSTKGGPPHDSEVGAVIPITMISGTYSDMFHGVSKPIYTWGGPTLNDSEPQALQALQARHLETETEGRNRHLASKHFSGVWLRLRASKQPMTIGIRWCKSEVIGMRKPGD